jgi:hypothetical protein
MEKRIKKLAEDAKATGHNDLAIVLYTYLGSHNLGMSSDFARYCQVFAREGIEQVETRRKNRRN